MGAWTATELRWRSPTYCIEQRGGLWNGEGGALPAGYGPQCPTTASYRADVRRGDTRVEQYVTAGWRPDALAAQLRAHGFREFYAELLNPGLYEAMLEGPQGQVYYLATLQGGTTEITISGPR